MLSSSYEARACGVRTAMGGRQARQLCPRAIVVTPRMSAYSEASAAVFEVFDDTTPLVEGLSIDEAFLDVGGLRRIAGTPTEIARAVAANVLERVGLPITVGVARTKFLAKVASGVAKPDGLLVVPPSGELDFLHPLRVERLWGVGPATADKLHAARHQHGGRRRPTHRGVARLDARRRHRDATSTRSPTTATLGRWSSVADDVRSARNTRSAARRRSADDIDAVVVGLVDRVAGRMRASARVGRTVTLRLRFDDFSRATRSHTMPQATAQTHSILATVRGLLATAAPMIEAQGLTLIGIAVGNLADADAVQLALPFDRHRDPALDVALDDVRSQFGAGAVTRAAPDGA